MPAKQLSDSAKAGPTPLSRKQQRALERHQKRQVRQHAKAARRKARQQQIRQALQAIGATWEHQGKGFWENGRHVYAVTWQGERYVFERPQDIRRWARASATPRAIDYAELEIARLSEQARRELKPAEDEG